MPEISHGQTCPEGTAESSRETIPGPDGDTLRLRCRPDGEANPASPRRAARPSVPEPLKNVFGIIHESSILNAIYRDLDRRHYRFVYGPAGKGTYIDREAETVTIDKNAEAHPEELVGLLAHEFGHARYTPKILHPEDFPKEDDFVRAQVKDNLLDEGEASMVAVQAAGELHAKKVEVDVPGVHHDEYVQIFAEFLKTKDRKTACEKIGAIFGSGENPSNDPADTYEKYYSIGARKLWERARASEEKIKALEKK